MDAIIQKAGIDIEEYNDDEALQILGVPITERQESSIHEEELIGVTTDEAPIIEEEEEDEKFIELDK